MVALFLTRDIRTCISVDSFGKPGSLATINVVRSINIIHLISEAVLQFNMFWHLWVASLFTLLNFFFHI